MKFFQKFHSQIGDCEVFSKKFTVLKIFHIQFECSNPLKMDAKSCYEHEMWQFFRLRQPNNDKMVFRYIIIDENAARRAAKIFETKKFHSRFRAKKKHWFKGSIWISFDLNSPIFWPEAFVSKNFEMVQF